MINHLDRRAAMQLSLLSWGFATAGVAWPWTAFGSESLIAPPAGPMQYSRRLTNELAGGQNISVFRQFSVAFTRFSDGFLIEGEQTSVRVDAPDNLTDFAALEEQRVEDGLFPIVLDPVGRLQTEAATDPERGTISEAASIAADRIAALPLSQGDQANLAALVSSIETAAAQFVAQLPTDLFCPPAEARIAEQAVQLPDGMTGKVITRFSGTRNWQTGLMRNAARTIITEVGSDRKRIVEEWQLHAP